MRGLSDQQAQVLIGALPLPRGFMGALSEVPVETVGGAGLGEPEDIPHPSASSSRPGLWSPTQGRLDPQLAASAPVSLGPLTRTP